MKKQYSITISAPMDKVFEAVTGGEGIKNFMHGKMETEIHRPGDSDSLVGTKFKQKVAGMYEFNGEVIAYRKPFQFGVGLEDPMLRATFFYNFEAVDTKITKLTCDLEVFDGNPVKKALTELSAPLFDKMVNDQMESIKKLAEKNSELLPDVL